MTVDESVIVDRVIDLNELSVPRNNRPGIISWALTCVDSAIHVFNESGNQLPVILKDDRGNSYQVTGTISDPRAHLGLQDTQESTEYGACAVAAQLVEQQHGLTICGRSPKNGSHYDYYLWPSAEQVESYASKDEQTEYVLSKVTYTLEVSGMAGITETISTRVGEKRKRALSVTRKHPVIVCVVHFRDKEFRMEVIHGSI